MKGFLIRAGIYAAAVAALLAALYLCFVSGIRSYPLSIAEDNSLLKQTGGYFLDHVPDDNVLVLGSSELNEKMIASHPVNLMKNGRGGVVFNIVGRGSCQAIVHASILAAAKDLSDRKVVIILSPQSYVPQGIMPDMYFANFSELQFCRILLSRDLPGEIKDRFKGRMAALAGLYEEKNDKFYPYEVIAKSRLAEALSLPYIWAREKLLAVKDAYTSYVAYRKAPRMAKDSTSLDWQDARAEMLRLAAKESDSNEFRLLNDYYAVHVKRKLETFANKDAGLSYADSVEYGDLELLLDICKTKGISPLVISVPLHGPWSDYTGFPRQEREKYYTKVNALVRRYDAQLCDFTDKEYEPYFLCDVMHLGWIGWLDTNERTVAFYNAGNR